MPATLPAAAFIAALLVLFPLPSHWRARNVATLSLIAWLFVVDVIYGVNTTVWLDNAEVLISVWCDITTKLIIGASSALPAATLCICKHLEYVASGRRVVCPSFEDKRRRMIFELVMCVGVPAVLMALHYVVQGHRFDIIQGFGCQAATYYSVPAIFIVWFPPLFFSFVTLIYASMALCHFFKQRIHFSTHLRNSNSALTTSRYLRLIAMSIMNIVWGSSLTALAMYDNILPGLRPYLSWSYVHSDFSRIGQYALVEFTQEYLQQLYLFWWALPASSYIFFLFFGFGEETVKDYAKAYSWLRRRVLRKAVKPAQSIKSAWAAKKYLKGDLEVSIDVEVDHTLPAYTPIASEKALALTPSSFGEKGTYRPSTITFTDVDLSSLLVTPTTADTDSPTTYTYPPPRTQRPLSQPLSPYSSTTTIAIPSPTYSRPLSTPTAWSVQASYVPNAHRNIHDVPDPSRLV